MATHRTIPGAHLSTADAGTTGQDRKDTTGDLGTELPGSTGIGSGLGAGTSGFGAVDSLATPPAADDREPHAAGDAGRQYPRAVGVLDDGHGAERVDHQGTHHAGTPQLDVGQALLHAEVQIAGFDRLVQAGTDAGNDLLEHVAHRRGQRVEVHLGQCRTTITRAADEHVGKTGRILVGDEPGQASSPAEGQVEAQQAARVARCGVDDGHVAPEARACDVGRLLEGRCEELGDVWAFGHGE